MKMPPPIATKFTKLVLTILAITILGSILSFISQDHTLLMLSAGVAVAGGVKIIDYPEGLDNKFSMNKPPNPCPSLYCDLVLLNDPNNGRSYLGWNEAEKSYYITDWIELIAGWLSERGYHLDGKMFAVVEGGMSYYTITVDGAKVTSTEFTPEATYVSEFNDLLYED